MSLLADENFATVRHLLKACCDVERVTRRILLLRRSSGGRKHFSGVHADGAIQLDCALDRQGLAEIRYGTANLESGPHCAKRVVFVHSRQSEDADDGVADKFGDPAAVALHR